MDFMNKLGNLVEEANHSLPFRPNNTRYRLDCLIIPSIVYTDGTAFVQNLLDYKEHFICDLFNRYYERVKPPYCSGSPKTFSEDEFMVVTYAVSETKTITYIMLPTRFDGSILFCSAYVFAYEIIGGKPSAVKFFTIEESMYGTRFISTVRENGEHQDICKSTGNIREDIGHIIETAFSL